jgi:hypothetical protein
MNESVSLSSRIEGVGMKSFADDVQFVLLH